MKKKNKYSTEEIKYLKSLCEMRCTFCGKDPSNNAHHIRAGVHAIAMKGKMFEAVPCCHICHDDIHARIGEKPFYKKYGYTIEDVKEEARQLWEEYKCPE